MNETTGGFTRKDAELENDPLTREIIAGAIEVHRHLGPGLLESIYEEALCYEFDLRSIEYARQVEVDVVYKGRIIKGQRLDLLVQGAVVVEIKSVSQVPDAAFAQVLSYMKAGGIKCGLLINFGKHRLVDGLKRFVL